MSSDVIARLESLLDRVIARRAVARLVPAAPVAPPAVATSPAPRAISPEPPKPDGRVEARRPEAPAAAPAAPPVVVEAAPKAPPPVVIEPVVEAPAAFVEAAPVVAPAPVAEAPKPVVIEPVVDEPVVEAPKPLGPPLSPPLEPTLVSRRNLEPLSAAPAAAAEAPKTSLPLPGPARVSRADDRVAASFAAGASVSPGLGDDDADHVETLAFRVGRALPKPGQVPAPPLPVTTRDEPGERRSDPGERRSERYTASLPAAPIAAQVAEPAARPAPASLRSLLQRSLALRPRG